MIPRAWLTVIALVVLCPLCPCGESLEARLAPLARAHKGKVAIAVKHLDTGESYYLNADEVLPTASLIKVAVMLETYQQVAEGKVKLSDTLTLRNSDKVPGSGILTYHFSEGATFPLRDAVRLMIAYSDNTATNLILDRVGVAAVTRRMGTLGFPETRLNAKVYRGKSTSIDPARTKKYGLGSTTARETLALFERLHHGKLVSASACKEMIGHLKQCQDKDKIKRLLPAGVEVAHKSGAVSDVRTDAGILYLPGGPVALCVLTAGNADRRWARDNAAESLIGRIALEVYQHFTVKDGKQPTAVKK
jgi:beta-lactamase class A